MSETKKSATERRFSSEEVADIIRLSLQDESRYTDNSVDYEELLSIAKDVGVDSERVDRAVHLLQDEQAARDKEQYLWLRFKAHAVIFAAVNFLLVTVNILSGSETFWSMYVLLSWGLFLLGHYVGLRYAPQFVELAVQRTRQMVDNKYQELLNNDDQVIFTTSDAMGMTETQGMVTTEDDKLVLEYQTVDALLGMVKTGVKVVDIPFDNLGNARLEQKLWNTDLVLQGKNMRAFGNAPGSGKGQLRVKVNRQSQAAARQLVKAVKSKLAD